MLRQYKTSLNELHKSAFSIGLQSLSYQQNLVSKWSVESLSVLNDSWQFLLKKGDLKAIQNISEWAWSVNLLDGSPFFRDIRSKTHDKIEQVINLILSTQNLHQNTSVWMFLNVWLDPSIFQLLANLSISIGQRNSKYFELFLTLTHQVKSAETVQNVSEWAS